MKVKLLRSQSRTADRNVFFMLTLLPVSSFLTILLLSSGFGHHLSQMNVRKGKFDGAPVTVAVARLNSFFFLGLKPCAT